jgi:hypothetical protein
MNDVGSYGPGPDASTLQLDDAEQKEDHQDDNYHTDDSDATGSHGASCLEHDPPRLTTRRTVH